MRTSSLIYSFCELKLNDCNHAKTLSLQTADPTVLCFSLLRRIDYLHFDDRAASVTGRKVLEVA